MMLNYTHFLYFNFKTALANVRIISYNLAQTIEPYITYVHPKVLIFNNFQHIIYAGIAQLLERILAKDEARS